MDAIKQALFTATLLSHITLVISTTVLITFINNHNSIAKGTGDPRWKSLVSVAIELKRRGHRVVGRPVDAAACGDCDNFFTRFEYFMLYKEHIATHWLRTPLAEEGRPIPDFLLEWYSFRPYPEKVSSVGYLAAVGGLSTPRLVYENGLIKGAVTVDPRGLLSDSAYVDVVNDLMQENYDDEKCRKHLSEHLLADSSKRPQLSLQSNSSDIPPEIRTKYIFVPTQKSTDLSIRYFSPLPMSYVLDQTATFCWKHNLPMVVKVHPHLLSSEFAAQVGWVKTWQRRYKSIYLSEMSINFLTSNARFTVSLNMGQGIDNFYTQTPIIMIGQSMFQNSEATIHPNISMGMRNLDAVFESMLKLEWGDLRQLRQRQAICWYRNMSLNEFKSGSDNVAVVQEHFRLINQSYQFAFANISDHEILVKPWQFLY